MNMAIKRYLSLIEGILRIYQPMAAILEGITAQTNVVHGIEQPGQQTAVPLVALAPGLSARFAKPTLHAHGS